MAVHKYIGYTLELYVYIHKAEIYENSMDCRIREIRDYTGFCHSLTMSLVGSSFISLGFSLLTYKMEIVNAKVVLCIK